VFYGCVGVVPVVVFVDVGIAFVDYLCLVMLDCVVVVVGFC